MGRSIGPKAGVRAACTGHAIGKAFFATQLLDSDLSCTAPLDDKARGGWIQGKLQPHRVVSEGFVCTLGDLACARAMGRRDGALSKNVVRVWRQDLTSYGRGGDSAKRVGRQHQRDNLCPCTWWHS